MRHLLNTIYITMDNAWLKKDGANIVIEAQGVERGRVPLHMFEGVVGFNRPGASPALLAACAEAGICVSFLNPNGRFLARVEGQRSGNVHLRRAQFRAAGDPEREEVRHPFLSETIAFGLVAHVQAQLLARHLRGDIDGYPPFLWR